MVGTDHAAPPNLTPYPPAGSRAASVVARRFQYTGQVWLAELGMYYYKARVYSPTLGRFLQTDPIGYEDQFNLYAYVGNDPVNGVDPTGMEEEEPEKVPREYTAAEAARDVLRRTGVDKQVRSLADHAEGLVETGKAIWTWFTK